MDWLAICAGGVALIVIVWAIWYTHKCMNISNYHNGDGKEFEDDCK